jgi:hypothetical protein
MTSMNGTNKAFRVGIALLLAAAASCGGCQLVSGMTESYLRSSTKTVPPEWDGLKGKTIGVLVAMDPSLHTRFPQMEFYLIARVTERLADPAHDTGVTGYTDIRECLAFSANNPGWIAKSAEELGKGLGGVECVIVVELDDFRLHDPGNMYTWDGEAAGTLGVFDLTGPVPNEFAFRKAVTVRFPDTKGAGPDAIAGDVVSTELIRRFVDRTTWAFYTHEEPYYAKY